jgi:ABC-type glutathione transport system ATPase component
MNDTDQQAGQPASPADAATPNPSSPAPQADASPVCKSDLLEPGEPIIKFEKVVKRFGDVTVLDELDFEVRKGEKVTIIGPSGSGKSTVLRILMTLETINEGVIWVAGRPLWHEERNGSLAPASEEHLRDMRKEMGMVFQQFNLFPHMTVRRRAGRQIPRSGGVDRSRRQIPKPAFRRPATARGHCARPGHAAQHHAVR